MVTSPSHRRRVETRFLAVVVASIMIFALTAACEEKNAYVPPPPPQVTVATPVRKAVTDYLEFTGNIQAIYTVQLPARVEGYLVGIHFQDGADVKKGDLLFTIQPQQYQAQLQQAEASVLEQRAALEHAEREFARYSKLFAQKAAPATEVDRWQFERDSAKAGLLNAQAQVDLAKLNVGYTRVVAPFDGRMGRHLVDIGNLVGAGQDTVLAEINHIDPIYVYFTINELDLLRVKKLQQQTGAPNYRVAPVPAFVGLADEQGYPREGQLDFAGISINPSTGTLLLRAIMPNPDRSLVPGMFARVRVPIARQQQAIMVPEVAVGFDQIGRYVLVVDASDVVERRSVTTGVLDGQLRVIEGGLKGDERVIVNGLIRAFPGRKVTPKVEEAQASPTAGAVPAAGG